MNNTLRMATLAAAVTATLSGTQPAMAQTLEEIVVTAQKRAANLQDVVIAMTSVSGDELKASRVFNAENINVTSPSITLRPTSNAATSPNLQYVVSEQPNLTFV